MSVNVRLKQKSFFKKKFNIDEIVKLLNLSYGVCDESYRLNRNETANHTLIYDENNLARGIDLSLDGTDILLSLSLPTSKEEIRCFYNVIDRLCNELKIQKYIRDEEQVHIKDKEKFIKYDEEGSISGLKNIQKAIMQNKYNHFEIFGIYNPISIGMKEIKEINNNLDNFSSFLNRIQSLDVYYAAPRVYKVHDRLIGVYVIGVNIPSVVPTKPYIVLNQIQGIEEWYVVLKEGKTIKYKDFINNIDKDKYYDANHIIVVLNEEKVNMLIDKYFIKL